MRSGSEKVFRYFLKFNNFGKSETCTDRVTVEKRTHGPDVFQIITPAYFAKSYDWAGVISF